MAVPSQRKFDDIHAENLEKYSRQVKKAYLAVIREAAKLAVNISPNAKGEFYFRSYPALNKKINELILLLYDEVYALTVNGVDTEWGLAVDKNNTLAPYVFGDALADLPAAYQQKYLSPNNGAKQAFVGRKIDGLRLSDRVWNNCKQFKQELELAVEQGIGKGRSADNMARGIRQYLNEPDKLFRRVRDDTGELRLSKAAKAYKPGQGVYRSSYKNAQRLTANETNVSYETSNQLKRQSQDFVVGVKVRASPSHKLEDDRGGICCKCLEGNYPVGFDFSEKWHIKCKCTSFSILKTREELDQDTELILSGEAPTTPSQNEIKKNPQSFHTYVSENIKKWEGWKRPPNFSKNYKK